MPNVNISREAESAIRAHSWGEFVDVPPRSDGSYDVWLAWDTLYALQRSALAGEDVSETILRLCATHKHGAN